MLVAVVVVLVLLLVLLSFLAVVVTFGLLLGWAGDFVVSLNISVVVETLLVNGNSCGRSKMDGGRTDGNCGSTCSSFKLLAKFLLECRSHFVDFS